MLKNVTLTRHETVESWNSWVVAVPDDMKDDHIEGLIRQMCDNGDLELNQEEREDDGEPSVDICEADPEFTTPDLTLTEDGLVDEDSIITAFTTDRLQAELERRRAKGSEMSQH
jgi:hypothetical protein